MQPNSILPRIFVIGTASLDVLHPTNGATANAAGGAGLYTALAACKAGELTGLFAPKPTPMPLQLHPVNDRLPWTGPKISPDNLPRLEIRHHGGGKATLLNASWGAEPHLTPNLMPPAVTAATIIHIAALSNAERQLEFLYAIRQRLAHSSRPPQISVGTYARLVYGQTGLVRRLFNQADLFFMNENEAIGLFGDVAQARTRKGALLFVTMDSKGALVIEGQQVTHVPGHPVAEFDPTGAGDTFCGATLAGLIRGLTPVEAAQQGVKLAAQTVSKTGPTALLT